MQPPTDPPERPDSAPDVLTTAEQKAVQHRESTWTPPDHATAPAIWVWCPPHRQWHLAGLYARHRTPSSWWASIIHRTGGHGAEIVPQWRVRPFDTSRSMGSE